MFFNSSHCFVIAEIGINHNGKFSLAKKMIESAHEVGAHAVKFQIYSSHYFVTNNALVYGKNKKGLAKKQSDMLRTYELTFQEWKNLKKIADKIGIIFFASVFDAPSIEIGISLDLPIYKIASCDLTNIPLIRKIASLKKPVLLSTGMADLNEIQKAIEIFQEAKNNQLLLMQCTSNYPNTLENAHVRTIPFLKEKFNLPVGFSDHCKENFASFAAVALGACVIEKHFTIDNHLIGVDQKMSLNPHEFSNLVSGITAIEKSLGSSKKKPLNCEKDARIQARRSLFAARNIQKGETIKPAMLIAKRPGNGISPLEFDQLIGRKTNQSIKKDELFKWEYL